MNNHGVEKQAFEKTTALQEQLSEANKRVQDLKIGLKNAERSAVDAENAKNRSFYIAYLYLCRSVDICCEQHQNGVRVLSDIGAVLQ